MDRRISAGSGESTIGWTAYNGRVMEFARYIATIGQARGSTVIETRFLKSGYAKLGESIVREQCVSHF